MMKFQCKFTANNGAYAMNFYDLESNIEDDIREAIESDGWDVDEIYDIRVQL